MAGNMTDAAGLVHGIGDNLRQARHRRGLSLVALAERSSVARAGIANIEAGKANPTIETLWALATALDVPFGELIAISSFSAPKVLRADDGVQVSGVGERARLLARVDRGGIVETYDLRFEAHDRRDAAAHYDGVREHLVVTQGRLLAGLSRDPVELAVGDQISFTATEPHVYAALGGRAARAMLLMDYPPAR